MWDWEGMLFAGRSDEEKVGYGDKAASTYDPP